MRHSLTAGFPFPHDPNPPQSTNLHSRARTFFLFYFFDFATRTKTHFVDAKAIKMTALGVSIVSVNVTNVVFNYPTTIEWTQGAGSVSVMLYMLCPNNGTGSDVEPITYNQAVLQDMLLCSLGMLVLNTSRQSRSKWNFYMGPRASSKISAPS
jgi:hypothetical protein